MRLLALTLVSAGGATWGQAQQSEPTSQGRDLTQVSIENLMNMEVTSVSRKEQKVSQTAAAIFVITSEDIRRSGMTSIPEVLRMVPGLEVAHIDGSKWAISARGFNERFVDKLLVLIDGRSLYSSAREGVFWEVQNLLLEDIERIEVIRGPGATLWGPGAINGVINIITRPAKETKGGLVTAGGGLQERAFGGARLGGQAGSNGHYRVYGTGFDRGPFGKDPDRAFDADGWHMFQGGFRTDWELSRRDAVTVEGDTYQGDQHQLFDLVLLTPPFSQEAAIQTSLSGGDALARWTRTYSASSEMSVQLYYEADTQKDITLRTFAQSLDFDFQDRFALGSQHDIVWGLGYRRTSSTFDNTFQVAYLPATQALSLYSGFVQDEITLVPNRLHFIAGIKFENAPYTGFNVQPNARLLWTPTPKQTIWSSFAIAQRTPDRADRGLVADVAAFPGDGGTPAVIAILGSPNTRNERVQAYELGYRVQAASRLSVDLATFCNRYRDLGTNEPGVPFLAANPAPTHFVIPLYFANGMHGRGYGAELSTGWQVTSAWKLNVGYTYLKLVFQPNPGSLDSSAGQASGQNPNQQVQVRSQWNLRRNFEFDQSAYFVSRLAASNDVVAYARADLRLGWRPTERTEISIVGQNLGSPHHLEFPDGEGLLHTEDVQKVFAKISWRF